MHDLEQSRFQEVLNEIPFSRFLDHVDSEIWRLHLLLFNGEAIWELMITAGNKQKKQSNPVGCLNGLTNGFGNKGPDQHFMS